MRGYIRESLSEDRGCRGGFYKSSNDSDDYSLEIGVNCHCDPEMAVVGSYCDEIIEFLKNNNSYIGKILLKNIQKDIETFNDVLTKSKD